MSFTHPHVLWLLCLPILWGVWQWVRNGCRVRLPFDHGNTRDSRALGFLTRLAGTAPAGILAAAILLLAGPQRLQQPQSERVMGNIILCFDVSLSMGERFHGETTKFQAAADAARGFCSRRNEDSFGLTVFGSEWIDWVPVTRDLSAINHAVEHIRPADMPVWMHGTAIARALRGCASQLGSSRDGDRAIILISDGGSSDFVNGGDQAVADEMATQGIRVFCISVFGENDSPVGLNGLQLIAERTGGGLFTAGDPRMLTEIFREIDRMQKAKFRRVAAEWCAFRYPFALGGLGFLALHCVALLGLRFNPW